MIVSTTCAGDGIAAMCCATVRALSRKRSSASTLATANATSRGALGPRTKRDLLTECESHQIGFIPYRPLRAWDDAMQQQALTRAASRHNATTDQVALAWLLAISPVTLPIPGTATQAHLETNVAAAALQLERDEVDAISAAVSGC